MIKLIDDGKELLITYRKTEEDTNKMSNKQLEIYSEKINSISMSNSSSQKKEKRKWKIVNIFTKKQKYWEKSNCVDSIENADRKCRRNVCVHVNTGNR